MYVIIFIHSLLSISASSEMVIPSRTAFIPGMYLPFNLQHAALLWQ